MPRKKIITRKVMRSKPRAEPSEEAAAAQPPVEEWPPIPPPPAERPRKAGYAVTALDDGKGYIMAEIGCSDADIRKVYGIPESTWRKGLDNYPDIKERLEQARARGRASIVKRLFDKAMEGDMGAIRFWLCNRDPSNWKAAIKVEAEHSGRIESPGAFADISDEELLVFVRRAVASDPRGAPTDLRSAEPLAIGRTGEEGAEKEIAKK